MTTNTLNPYAKPNSTVARIFELAKAGTTKKDILAICKKEDIGAARVLRELKLEDFRGLNWKYNETEAGAVKISGLSGTVKIKGKAKVAKSSKKTSKSTKGLSAAKRAALKEDDLAPKLKASVAKAKAAKAKATPKVKKAAPKAEPVAA